MQTHLQIKGNSLYKKAKLTPEELELISEQAGKAAQLDNQNMLHEDMLETIRLEVSPENEESRPQEEVMSKINECVEHIRSNLQKIKW